MARHQSPAQKKTVERVMHEFKHGELKTAGGKRKVKNPKQAIAIALHEAGASKYESPKENDRNLRRTKEKERRGETGQDAAEGKGPRKTAARTSTRKSSSTKSTKRTRTAAARSSSPSRSAGARRTSSTAKRTSGTKRSSSTKRAASTARSSSTNRSAATKRASSTDRKRSSGDGKTRAELYKEASRRNISGRSKMSKAQLERALSR